MEYRWPPFMPGVAIPPADADGFERRRRLWAAFAALVAVAFAVAHALVLLAPAVLSPARALARVPAPALALQLPAYLAAVTGVVLVDGGLFALAFVLARRFGAAAWGGLAAAYLGVLWLLYAFGPALTLLLRLAP